jgi:CHAT domain-containing protein
MCSASRSWISGSLLCLTLAAISAPAPALTMDQARENCRNTVGRVFVQSCMRANGGDRATCREKATPRMHACVMNAMNAANRRANVPVALPAQQKPAIAIGNAISAAFVAPPRSITDITAILDGEKPDPKQIEELKSQADAAPEPNSSRADLAQFYYDRGNARAQLGRLSESIADANKAIEVGHGAVDANLMGRLQQFAGLQYSAAGDPKRALAMFSGQMSQANAKVAKGYRFSASRQIAAILIRSGDLAQADTFVRRNMAAIQEARTSGLPAWRKSYAVAGQSWESEIELGRGMLFEARGQFREAEAAYRLAEQRKRAAIPGILNAKNPPPESQLLAGADTVILSQARMKAKQGRLAEAEADARRALLSRLKDQGKFNPSTPKFIMGLAGIMVEQGRYADAEKLTRVSIDINRTVGVAEEAQSTASLLSALGGILNLQRKFQEAARVYAELDKAIANWDPQRRQVFDLNGSRIYSLYASGRIETGISAAQALLRREIRRVGENHFDTAAARGILAMGYSKAGRDAEAAQEFRTAIPLLMAAARENADDDDTTVVAARNDRLQMIVEAYISLLDRMPAGDDDAVTAETFRLADAIRGHSVQQALAASSARMFAKDPALADLARKEQDLTKQVNAQLGTLNNVLSLPSSERNEKGVAELNASIDQLRNARNKVRASISKEFPSYADLIDPKAPTLDEIKATLRPGEALLSFYFGREISFVWAVPAEGRAAFATIPMSADDLESMVRKLREALEPNAEFLGDIPAFDLALAYDLYNKLLAPVANAWKPAKNLIVVTNGALGLLPLSVLPTAPSQVKETETMFAGYRDVSWLARTHAVTLVPSAAALKTLRLLPPGSSQREKLIAFGDPIFNPDQLDADAPDDTIQLAALTRGIPLKRRAAPHTEGVDSAELAILPRLPDTAAELKAMALALQADPAKVLYLGKDANEQRVRTTDLSKFKIIAFATHGLVPGDLNGLVQPALALTAPKIAGVEGDGLLTMEEILALKLDADWVVLSACNTGAGAGAGAEAASGLGRAFFYAGTRAILVTNWSVHSASARELVSDLFRRQSQDPGMTRGEALRRAMVALMDGDGYKDETGKSLFTYAHPLFWAPYSIIGDGG